LEFKQALKLTQAAVFGKRIICGLAEAGFDELERIPGGKMARRILVVDDENTLREMLKDAFSERGYLVATAPNVPGAREVLSNSEVDLIVLDLMMPGESGFELLEWARNVRQISTPVILLTAVSNEDDKLRAFGLGADDYVVKPFSLREFIARVEAVTRRAEANIPDEIEFGDCRINRRARIVYRGGEEVPMRLKEYQILLALAEHPNVAVSRQELFRAIWGNDSPSGEKTVDVTIHSLRDKIELDPANPDFIITVRGFGYRFDTSLGGSNIQQGN
jgi:DNA-binding response OmpR family regulator